MNEEEMTDKEMLQWLIDHDGNCHESPWGCDECPVDSQCVFGVPDKTTANQAKILLASKEAEDKIHQANWLIEHDGDCALHPWKCGDCIVNNQHHFSICSISGTLKIARDILDKDKHSKRLLKILRDRKAVNKIHEGISAMKEIDKESFHRDDHVLADGKEWRIDYTDGPYLGLSAPDGSHKELHKNVCEKVSTKADRVADIIAMVTMP